MNETLLDLIKQNSGPVASEEDYRAIAFRLYKALSRLIDHEGTGRWTQAPFPHSRRLGCQYCEREWVAHAPDCLYLRVKAFLNDMGRHFPSS